MSTTPSTPSTPFSWREGLCAALVLLVLAGAALRPSIRGNDGYGNYVYLASLMRGFDIDFRDDYEAIDSLEHYPFKLADLPRHPATGLPGNRYGVGSALLWAPFVAFAHVAVWKAHPDQANGFGPPYALAVGLGTAFWGSLGLWLLFRRLRGSVPRGPATAVILGLIFATPLGFYLYAHGSMSHGVSFFAAVGLLLSFERAWRNPRSLPIAWCACWCALLVMIRAQDAPWSLLAAAALSWRALNQPDLPVQSRVAPLALATFAGIVTLIPQFAVWQLLYGSPLAGPAPYLDESSGSFSPWPAHFFQALFSARHGVLVWHPLFLFALIGCGIQAHFRDQDGITSRFALIGFFLQSWLVGCWSMWWAGASFGNRFFISALPFLAVGLACWIARAHTRRARAAWLALLCLLCAWNGGLLVQYATGMISREDPVAWRQVLRQNIIDVPKLLFAKVSVSAAQVPTTVESPSN